MDFKEMTNKKLVKTIVSYAIEQQELEKRVQELKDIKKEMFNELRARGIIEETCSIGSVKWKEGYTRTTLDSNTVKTFLTKEQQAVCEKITQVAGLYVVSPNKREVQN